jgi:hypothetical protein
MKQQNVISAESIKSQLIDFFITDFSNDLFIGNEVMYGTKRKLVDLLVLSNNQLFAIEIKADNDDLRRMQEQIEESKKIFNYIIVCTTITHLEKTKQSLPDDIGIYCVNEQGVTKIRKPKKQKKLDKTEILYSINSNFLRKELATPASNINSDEIRRQYFKKSIDKIYDLFTDYLQQKVQSRFNLFLQNRGEYTHIEDISLLSTPLYIQ